MSAENGNSKDLYELYALGLLDEEERARIEEELRSGSEESTRRLREALRNNAMLMAQVPLHDPPKGLRQRVVAIAGDKPGAIKETRLWQWAWALAMAAMVIGVYISRDQISQKDSEIAQVRRQLQGTLSESARTNAELARVRNVLSFLNAPETKLVTFGPPDPKPPRGRVLLNPSRGVLLIASNLPPAPAGRIYEMWLIPKGGKPVPAGLFQSDDSGSAVHLREGSVDTGVTVAVTLEPESGSEQPTTTPLFAASL